MCMLLCLVMCIQNVHSFIYTQSFSLTIASGDGAVCCFEEQLGCRLISISFSFLLALPLSPSLCVPFSCPTFKWGIVIFSGVREVSLLG